MPLCPQKHTDFSGQCADFVAPDVEGAEGLDAEDDRRDDGQIALGEVQLDQRGQLGERLGQRRGRPAARRGRVGARVRSRAAASCKWGR